MYVSDPIDIRTWVSRRKGEVFGDSQRLRHIRMECFSSSLGMQVTDKLNTLRTRGYRNPEKDDDMTGTHLEQQ